MAYLTTFKVRGRGDFPIDMLRYDSCYPTYQESVSSLRQHYGSSEDGARDVELSTWSSTAHEAKNKPTEDRWKSFGWLVVESSFRKI